MFGSNIEDKEISIAVYCDDRKIDDFQQLNNENWLYIALLLIPDIKKSKSLAVLNKNRGHAKYYYELKFRELGKPSYSSSKAKLAKLWLREVINDSDKRFYIKIFGIKKDNLLFELFGHGGTSKGKYANIYNRFFRTAFLSAINSFFPVERYEKVIISGLFHDRQGALEAHELFPWHICYRATDKRIRFQSNNVCFIDSNHIAESDYKDDSQFIQLIDLVVGSVSHCLDLPTKFNKGKNEVATVILPLLKEILEGTYSKQSRFEYFRKYDVSFFPSKRLTLEEFSNVVNRAQSNFFRNRRILLEEHKFGGQLPLKLEDLS